MAACLSEEILFKLHGQCRISLSTADSGRGKMIVVCGGPRISHELAKELGFDAGFGANTYADDVASFVCEEFVKRHKK